MKRFIAFGIILILTMMMVHFCAEEKKLLSPYSSKYNPDKWKPTKLELSPIDIHSVELKWEQEEENIDGFLIDKKIGNNEWSIACDTINYRTNKYIDTLAVPTEELIYNLYAYADDNHSKPQSKTITLEFPAPSNLMITQSSLSSIELNWMDNSDGEDGFQIDRKVENEAWQTGFQFVTGATWTDTSITPRQTYSYRISAFRDKYHTANLDTSITCTFPKPENLTITQESDVLLTLNWNENIIGEEGFIIDRKTNDGNWENGYATVGENLTTWSDESPVYGAENRYRLSAFYGDDKSELLETFIHNVISPPYNLSLNYSNDQVTISWADSCNFENAFLIEKQINDGNFEQIGEVGSNTHNFIDSAIEQDTNYKYRICAKTTNNQSEWALSNEFNTANNPPIASFTISPELGTVDTEFTFDASACSDNEDATSDLQVRWDFENDGTWDIDYSTTKTTSHTFSTAGTYTINMEVKDTYGLTSLTTKQVVVSENSNIETGSVTDIDGNVYKTVKIGDQWWMAENLKVTHYRNGDAIPNISDNTEWSNFTSGAFCIYNNDVSYQDTCGYLYNRYIVEDNRIISPKGWHVATNEDWENLAEFISNDNGGYSKFEDDWSLVGKHLKSIYGWDDNNNGIDEYGFAGYPCGIRWHHDGTYKYYGILTCFWTSPMDTSQKIYTRNFNTSDGFFRLPYDINDGISIRCVKGEVEQTNTSPTASFTIIPESGTVETEFTFDASACGDNEDATSELQVRWDFENDGTWDIDYSTTKTTSHTFTISGTYTIKMEVKDTYGSTGSITKQLFVSDNGNSETGSVTDIDGNTYKTVKIGEQWWMAEDLEVTHYRDGSEIPNITDNTAWSNLSTGAFSENKAIYGHLYNWYSISDKRKIAPEGWRVPSEEDWSLLLEFLGDSAVIKLKSTTGWSGYNRNGTDEYGFNSVPSGYRDTEGIIRSYDERAYYWTSIENDTETASRYLLYDNESIGLYYSDKKYGYAIRCILGEKVNDPPVAVLSVSPGFGDINTDFSFSAQNCTDVDHFVDDLQVRWDFESDGNWDTGYSTEKSISHRFTSEGEYTILLEVKDPDDAVDTATVVVQIIETGTVTDIEGNTYRTVKIGDQWWTAENLKVTHYRNGDEIEDAWAYENDIANAEKYGRLYSGDDIEDTRNIAPEGWHVPTDNEWQKLEVYLGISSYSANTTGWRGTNQGTILKSKTGWNGTDDYGFGVIAAGQKHTLGMYQYIWNAYFWCARNSSSDDLRYRLFEGDETGIYRFITSKGYGYSLRCIKDEEIINTPPTASFTVSSESGDTETQFTFNATSSTDEQDVASSLQVRWDFENDGTWDTQYSIVKITTHTYSLPGNYTIKLEVLDTDGATNQTTKSVTVEQKIDLNIEMVYLDAGNFKMGDVWGDGESDQVPTHTVALSDFNIGKYEITQQQYEEVMGESKNWTSTYGLGDNYPAYNVTWYEAVNFCNALSELEGYTPCYTIDSYYEATCDFTKNGYRLPTEAEWEYAARSKGRDDRKFSGTNNQTDLENFSWHNDNSGNISHEVGKKQANDIGLYDMSGNVWEWCGDYYEQYTSDSQVNPTGAESSSYRIRRGGAWNSTLIIFMTTSYRDNPNPSWGGTNTGFRIVRSDHLQSPNLPNTSPTATFTISPESGNTNTEFTFDASGCTDTEDATSSLQVRWDWENDGTWDVDYTTNKTKTYIFPSAGTYNVKLEVIDTGNLSTTITKSVTVNETYEYMVPITGGTFTMGDSWGDGEGNETPTHTVTVSDFYMAKTEITHADYIEFLNDFGVSSTGVYDEKTLIDIGDSDCAIKHDGSNFYFEATSYVPSDKCALIEVSWHGALQYCNWKSIKDGFSKVYTTIDKYSVTVNWNATGYRLPTEAEWEYASKGGSNQKWSGTTSSASLEQYGWFTSNAGGTVHEVGKKYPNSLGIYDLAGNVWEWCWDCYSYSYYSSSPSSNPQGPSTPFATRVLRGGYWGGSSTVCRSAQRAKDSIDQTSNTLGFRICRKK